jgi:lysophospholipase L1-like esterase
MRVRIIAEGDSITNSGYPHVGQGLFPATYNGGALTTLVKNLAMSGNYTNEVLARLARSGADAEYNGGFSNAVAPLFNSADVNIYTVKIGTNNVHRRDSTAYILNHWQQIHAKAQAYGYVTVAATMTPHATEEFNTRINELNPIIRANWQSWGAVALIDFAANPALDDPMDTTIYPDGLHPSAAGREYMARDWYAGVSAALVSMGYPALPTPTPYP